MCMGTSAWVDDRDLYVSSDNSIILSRQAKTLVNEKLILTDNQVLTWKKCKYNSMINQGLSTRWHPTRWDTPSQWHDFQFFINQS